MSDTQEKLCPECGLPITICNIVYFASIGFSEVKTVQQEYQRDARKEVQELIDSAKREGAIEELQMIPKEGYYGDEGTAVEYVKNRIAQLKQSEESEE